jgi:coenzyme F420-0:L-glutamate ligase / coenzyme F420-1:gamma-L-glutamate ligase
MHIKILGFDKVPIINEKIDIAELILKCLDKENIELEDGDILVIAETVISKAEGNLIHLKNLNPTSKAKELAKRTGKDPSLVEAIIRESIEILRVGNDFIVSETKHGFVCANAGIDESNVEKGFLTPIPDNPDESARIIRKKIKDAIEKDLVIIIADTQGRAFREGAIGVAIGIAGMNPIWNRMGETDLYGKVLKTTNIAVADELAAAASILMGQADEGIPFVLIKGVKYVKKLKNDFSTAKSLIRPKEYDLFR